MQWSVNLLLSSAEGVSIINSAHAVGVAGYERFRHPRVSGRSSNEISSGAVSRDCDFYSFTFRNRNEFVITETELKLMAAAANTGLSNQPVNG